MFTMHVMEERERWDSGENDESGKELGKCDVN